MTPDPRALLWARHSSGASGRGLVAPGAASGARLPSTGSGQVACQLWASVYFSVTAPSNIYRCLLGARLHLSARMGINSFIPHSKLEVDIIIIPILQGGKLRLRDRKELEGYSTSRKLDLELLSPRARL